MKTTIICPIYNEAELIENSIIQIKKTITTTPEVNQIILVNDGSTDNTDEIIQKNIKDDTRFLLISYPENRGRGYAIRQGLKKATGEIIITTEADMSWGPNIVERLLEVFKTYPSCDIAIASPHLPEGGYKNVPRCRQWISILGNKLLNLTFSKKITMSTGMTRAYKKWIIHSIDLESDQKEIHLEILSKAFLFDVQVKEIPAIIFWPPTRSQRNIFQILFNWKMGKIVLSHIFFGFKEAFIFLFIGTGLTFLFLGLFGLAIFSSNTFLSLLTAILALTGLQICIFCFLAYQNKKTRIDLVRMNKLLKNIHDQHLNK